LGWLRLMRVYQKIDRTSAENVRAWGISVAQFDVLAHVGAREGMTQQELADSLLVTKGNVCQLVGKLEDRGLISRCQQGRANRLFLTFEGRRLFEEVVPAQEAMISERFSALSDEEQAQLHELLRRLDSTLDRDVARAI
jgi:DNA-binding MarR family transcriptional regulator